MDHHHQKQQKSLHRTKKTTTNSIAKNQTPLPSSSNIQHHSATVHYSSVDSKQTKVKHSLESDKSGQKSLMIDPKQQQQTNAKFYETSSNVSQQEHYLQHHSNLQSYRPSNQVHNFDDCQLYNSSSQRPNKDHHHRRHHHQQQQQHYQDQSTPALLLQYSSQTEPKQLSSQRRRRHSSMSRLKAQSLTATTPVSLPSGAKSSSFINSITSNFMSFGAPFLFDWRLFCERGQPRYVHKHEGDGLRVDECEAKFLNKIAEEEKASLNAISDEDDHSTSLRHQQKNKNKSGSAAANVECLGSVRKSGFLSVKKWLIRKKNSLELARKRGWKGYWVCLKGTTLLFYRCDCGDNKSGGHVIEARPRHLIFVDACLVQAIPEHPKRDYVFCLSTAFGDAYLLDAPCLVERDHWIAAIHCACAAQLARSSGRATVSHVLHREIKILEETVELDAKSKTEAEQIIAAALAAGSLSAAEAKAKQQNLMNQIHNLEEKIEKNRTEIFRFRAYLAAIISEEDPNPKTLLSQTTKRSKIQLNRLGVFSVSSLHAFNCAKNPTIIGNLTRSSSQDEKLNALNHGSGVIGTETYEHFSQVLSMKPALSTAFCSGSLIDKDVQIVVKMLNGELHKFEFNTALHADQILSKLLPIPIARDYYLRHVDDSKVVFKRHETLLNHSSAALEIVPKIMFNCEMNRESTETLFGFSVESELNQDDLRVYVSRVEANSLAALQFLRRSDEIVVINGAFVQDLDMMYVESVLQEELALCLTIRAARDEIHSSRPSSQCNILNTAIQQPGQTTLCSAANNDTTHHHLQNEFLADCQSNTDDLIESLVCPPPPPIDRSQMILSEKQLSKYIVPKVDNYLFSPPATATIMEPLEAFSKQHCQHHHHYRRRCNFSDGKCSSARSCSTSKSASTTNAIKTILDPTMVRPHSVAGSSYPRHHHHHHHHHHGHHHHSASRSSNTLAGTVSGGGSGGRGSSHHHHHHHHHHHSSTKHIYHINEPQASNFYGVYDQQQQQTPSSLQQQHHSMNNFDVKQQVQSDQTLNDRSGCLLVPSMLQAQTEILNDVNQTTDYSQTIPVTYQDVFAQSSSGGGDEARDFLVDGNEMMATKTISNNNANLSCQSNDLSTTTMIKTSEITNEKLRKVVHELLDTEITYCQALDQLMTLYLDPLLKNSTLTNLDARILIGSIPSVIVTQNQFREDLTTIINADDLNIEGIAKCFLNYNNDFKSYSTFCASHAKATKLLADEKSILHEWIVKQSKSSKCSNMYSLESFLIRPIQRILKYPLLLSQIKTLCLKESQPYFKINEALRAIENVAEHINEMQRINEEYGSIFENLLASAKMNSKNKQSIYMFDLTPTSLLHYGGVEWINSVEFLGKSFKKITSSSGGLNLHSMCFVFKQCVVFLCKETIRHNKSKKQQSGSSAAATDVEIIRHQVLIPVSEVQVRACPQTEQELDFKWELIQLKSNAQGKRSEKIFRLSNSTNEYRNLFLRTIRQIIREDVRRMSIMGTKPISTKSETSPTERKKSEKRQIVSFASTQNLTRCGYCGEDFTKLVKKGS